MKNTFLVVLLAIFGFSLSACENAGGGSQDQRVGEVDGAEQQAPRQGTPAPGVGREDSPATTRGAPAGGQDDTVGGAGNQHY